MVNQVTALTVTQFVDLLNEGLGQLAGITVEGEVEDYKVIHNKWVVFQLKDADSSVGCFMPVWDLKTQIEDGMLVRAQGKPTIRNKGFFSFVLSHVAPAGEGSLKRAFELLKAKLTDEGLFAPERKRPLPRFPQHIALITSRDAAAYTDFVKILNERQGGLAVSFIHTQVQGEPAPGLIIKALEYANTHLDNLDAIVLIRGGGSLEDLHAFNDESVIRAVAASRTPTVVGIGHERDVSLAELAADVRASTPSNAAELLVRSRAELAADLARLTRQVSHRVTLTIDRRRDTLTHAALALRQRTTAALQERVQSLDHMTRLLNSLAPANVLRRGFSITRTANGRLVKDAGSVTVGDSISTEVARGRFTSTVTK